MSADPPRDRFYRADSDDNNMLQPADILLFEVIEPSSHLVARAQRIAGYEAPSSDIVHAALYIGHGCLCHASPAVWMRPRGGVVIQGAWGEISARNRKLFVLRDEKLSYEQRKDIALYAATKTKNDSFYEWRDIFNAVSSFAGIKSKQLKEKADGVMLELRNAIDHKLHFNPVGSRSTDRPLRSEALDRSLRSEQAKTKVVKQENADNVESDFNATFGGTVGFICSDLVVHCYNFILGKSSPFVGETKLRLPVYTPADIYLNKNLNSVKSNANEDAVDKMREALKGISHY